MHHQRDLLLKNIVNNPSCKSYKKGAEKHYDFVTFVNGNPISRQVGLKCHKTIKIVS